MLFPVYVVHAMEGRVRLRHPVLGTEIGRAKALEVLKGVTDPRDWRGVRHPLPAILCLAVTGLAGCRSLTAIWNRPTRGP